MEETYVAVKHMQEVNMSLLEPGQPMIVNASKGTLVFVNQILREDQLLRQNFSEKAGRSRDFRIAAKLLHLPKLPMQRTATVIRPGLPKKRQGVT